MPDDGFFHKPRKSAAEYEADDLEALRRRAAEIKVHRDAIENDTSSVDASSVEQAVEAIEQRLLSIVVFLGAQLNTVADTRLAKSETYRQFQYEHGVNRSARNPDPLDTLLLAMILILPEGGATAALMVADGKMTVVEGVIYGLIFAIVTVTTSMATGFFAGRFVAYKVKGAAPVPVDGFIRMAGICGSLFGLSLVALLIFNAARVRTLGGHEGIFNYAEVGFLETFNDGIAIIIMVFGLIAAVIGLWKGLFGFSDVIPGYTQARKDAEEAVNESAECVVEQAIDSVLNASEPLLESLDHQIADAEERSVALPKTIDAINAEIEDFNVDVQSRKEHLKAKVEDDCRIKTAITRKPCLSPPTIDTKAFDDLLIATLENAVGDDSNAAVLGSLKDFSARIANAVDNAVAEIEAAHAEYLATAPNLDIFPEVGGFND